MQITQSYYSVADFVDALNRKDIIVNRDYQRSDKVWPAAARSSLIDTILLNFPVPKLELYQVLDLKTKKAIKEIVDGQQRTTAILSFYNDELKLSKNVTATGAAGKSFSELSDELRSIFLNYQISVDVFLSATRQDIVEVFRRINSYTVPLNPEEKRHAKFQGEFKWFILGLTRKYTESLIRIGVFTEKQLVRMADAKLFTEIIHAFSNGITTTSASALDAIYAKNDSTFSESDAVEKVFAKCFSSIEEFGEIHRSPLMKPHVFYSLFLALCTAFGVNHVLIEQLGGRLNQAQTRQNSIERLSSLAEALESEAPQRAFRNFVKASESRTNVADQRIGRAKWFLWALSGATETPK